MTESLIYISMVLASVLPADGWTQPTDGIYRVIGTEDSGTKVTRTSGDPVTLGAKLSDNFGEAAIWSLSNHNNHFRVMMKDVNPMAPSDRIAIVIDGVCEMVNSYGLPQGDQGPTIQADIRGATNAAKVARRLDVELRERKHPGHQLKILWRPSQESYKIGQSIPLELEIENVGEVPIRFMEGGQQRGARDNQFGFTAFGQSGHGKPIPDTGNPVNFGGIAAFRELQPGETFKKQVDVSKWFQFEEPGIYEITGMYELELQDEDFSFKTLWSDFATGRCNVQLEK